MSKKKKISTRLAVVLIIVGFLLLLCIVKAIALVVKKGDSYSHKVLQQASSSTTTILSRPGNIIDANGLYLTSTRKVFRLILDPKQMQYYEENYPGSLDKTCEILAESFGLDKEELKEAFTKDPDSQYVRFRNCPILEESAVEAYEAKVTEFKERKTEFNKDAKKEDKIRICVSGVWFEEEYRRSYPFGDTLSKVIGYTTEDISEGILGLEKQYFTELSGTDGREYTYVDSEGNVTKDLEQPQNGYTLITSLDVNVSNILSEEIAYFQTELEGAERVNVLVMNPNTGEIIAMESDTEFDLNNPRDLTALFTEEELEHPEETFLLQEAFLTKPQKLAGMSCEERMTALLQQVQQNYQVSSAFEPGSTAKSLTIASAYEAGKLTRDSTWNCTGEIQVKNYTIHCHYGTLCGDLTAIESLGRSCNVCLVQIANDLGKDLFTVFQERFNFGQKTNIDLPGEQNTAPLIYSAENMGEVELATCSFGQGFSTTMVQMASAYASLLNGGNYYQPHVVTKIVDENGNTVKDIEPVLVRRTVSAETAAYMREGMAYVVSEGTANYCLNHEGYEMGGKTGAAEKLPRGTGKYITSFIGGAPLGNPKFLLYVVVDEPHTEDQSESYPAQKLASNIFRRLYSYYGIFPSTEADAYSYDWSNYKDFSGENDSAHGESNIDDPDNTIQWLQEQEPPEETP